MPSDAGNGSLNLIWIFEDHHGFCGYIFISVLCCFAREILFKKINLVVLSYALSDTANHFFSCLWESESSISIHLLCIFSLISRLSWINMSRPTTFSMSHSFTCGWNSICVHTMLWKLRDIWKYNFIRISLNELLRLIRIWRDTTNNFCISIFELSMSSKLFSLLLVCITVSAHIYCIKFSKFKYFKFQLIFSL